jgi:hypothetical protein
MTRRRAWTPIEQLLAVVIASWIVPPLLERFDVAPVLHYLVYIGAFTAIIHFADRIHKDAIDPPPTIEYLPAAQPDKDKPRGFLGKLIATVLTVLAIAAVIWSASGWSQRPHCEDDRLTAQETDRCYEDWYVRHGLMRDSDRTVDRYGAPLR